MGMDLEPINPTAEAPRYPKDDPYSPNQIIWGRYNWNGWYYQIDLLEKWGINTSEFAGTNDGYEICETTCLAVANAIEKHLPELSKQDQEWLQPKIIFWRTCGGYRQW